MSWEPANLPRQDGRTILVTGGNAGLGYFTAEQLAGTGAHVVLGARHPERAARAARSIRKRVADADVDVLPLDLADLAAVRTAAETVAGWDRLDGVVLNAGITSPSRTREVTVDGNEVVLQTNVLGHMALVALAWPALARTPGARIVGLGSTATMLVPLDDDLQGSRDYRAFRSYGLSKHAMHGLVFELDRRIRTAGLDLAAVLAQPGLALDGLSAPRPGITTPMPLERLLAGVAQGKNRGATPVLRALLDPDARSGDYFGPARLLTGRPVRARAVASSADPAFGRSLFARFEAWTGIPFPL